MDCTSSLIVGNICGSILTAVIIATFVLEKIVTFGKEDQILIDKYWEQRVLETLFIEDILGDIYSSKALIFSKGINQKGIYDRLALEASKDKYYKKHTK